MRANTITTKASTIVPGGILALSLAVVLLAATASTASANKYLGLWCAPLPTPPTTFEQIEHGCMEQVGRREVFDFGDRKVGTTSPAQGFELGLQTVNDIFNPTISVSGDYAQTNSCPPTLLYSCLITVTFTPTDTGPKRGTLRTGPGGPTVALTGNGVTTRTPPVLPLTLDVYMRNTQQLGRRGAVNIDNVVAEMGHCHVRGCPDYDAKLVLGGDVKKTTKQLPATNQVADPRTRIKARLKHLKQLRKEPTAPEIKIKFTATDEFGQRVTEERKVELCSPLIHVDRETTICRWHPSRK
jgi:hypothetical protein